MEKLLFLLLPLALLASCQPYGDKIVGNPYPSTACAFRPLDQATRDSAAKGWVSIDSAHAGNPLVCPMMVKVEASWPQKWAIARHNGTEWVALVIWFLAFLGLVVSFYEGVWGSQTVISVVLPAVIAIALCWLGAATVDWAFTKEIEVTKVLFDTPGALKAFWDANLFK